MIFLYLAESEITILYVLAGVAILIVLVGVGKTIKTAAQSAARKARIYGKYGHNETAERIIGKLIWVGETEEQLTDSMGPPVYVDDHVLKTKRKEVWKYAQTGRNRFRIRVTFENGCVIGWDVK